MEYLLSLSGARKIMYSLTILLKLKRMAKAKHCNDKCGTHELSCELPPHKEGSAGVHRSALELCPQNKT